MFYKMCRQSELSTKTEHAQLTLTVKTRRVKVMTALMSCCSHCLYSPRHITESLMSCYSQCQYSPQT